MQEIMGLLVQAAYCIYSSAVSMLYFQAHECQKVTDSRLASLSAYNQQTEQELHQGIASPVCNSFLLMSVYVCSGFEMVYNAEQGHVPPQDTTMSHLERWCHLEGMDG